MIRWDGASWCDSEQMTCLVGVVLVADSSRIPTWCMHGQRGGVRERRLLATPSPPVSPCHDPVNLLLQQSQTTRMQLLMQDIHHQTVCERAALVVMRRRRLEH